MTITETMNYLKKFQKSGKPVRDLTRIGALLDALGNPQEHLRVVHIAGTNGKGSVVALASAAAVEAGFRVGTLTSPFLYHYADRVQINGVEIDDDALCRHCARVKACGVSADCSQFEITFAIALLWFAEQNVDLVFLETGIGGLLDATNVIEHPLVCAITSISYDHMDILGDTLTKIAAQKAGIIKPGCPVVLSPGNPMDVVCLMQETAEKKNASLIIPAMLDCRVISETLRETVFCYHSFTYTLHMPGRHQVYNALTAIEVIRLLGMHGFLISAETTRCAFEKVLIPGRIQIFCDEPLVVLDGAHNQAGVMALVDLLHRTEDRPIHGVFGMMQNKDYRTISAILQQTFSSVVCVDDFAASSVPASVLASCFSKCPSVQISPWLEAFQIALQKAREDGGMVLCCGSLYLVSAVLEQGSEKI